MSRRPATWAALLAALTVAGCSGLNPFANEPVLLPCPDYSIPADSATVVQFVPGEGRDLIDVEHSGRIGNVRMVCEYDIDKETNAGTVTVEANVLFAVERGPANKSRRATYPYFIAVTDADKRVLYREELALRVGFAGNVSRRIVPGEKIVLEIPVKQAEDAQFLRLYTGFLLTEDQLAYNRKLRQARSRRSPR